MLTKVSLPSVYRHSYRPRSRRQTYWTPIALWENSWILMPMNLMKRLITPNHVTLQCSRFYTLISTYPDATSEQVLGSKSVLWELVNTGHRPRQSLTIRWIWPCVHTTNTQWLHIRTLLATKWKWDETMACLGLYLVIYILLNNPSYTYIIHGLICGNVLAYTWTNKTIKQINLDSL